MADAIVIAIVGAESTGKTTLASALAERLAADTGLAATWVPETLRDWCTARGRTPRRDEQAAIAVEHSARIEAAAARHGIVVCDTTALMTAVYSQLLFGDDSLEPMAITAHRRCTATLLTAIDLPWQGDGLQRDGPHVREPVDTLVRTLLARHGIGHAVVGGEGPARLAAARAACAPLWQAPAAEGPSTAASPLRDRSLCERCGLPDCEHRLRLGKAAT